MQIRAKQEKWFTYTENNLTDARIADVSMSKIPNPKDIRLKLNNFVSKCISMAWVLERSRFVTEIDHTTIINWVEEAGKSLSDEPQDEEIPEITEIDELQTFVGNKNNKFWIRICSQSSEKRDYTVEYWRSLARIFSTNLANYQMLA